MWRTKHWKKRQHTQCQATEKVPQSPATLMLKLRRLLRYSAGHPRRLNRTTRAVLSPHPRRTMLQDTNISKDWTEHRPLPKRKLAEDPRPATLEAKRRRLASAMWFHKSIMPISLFHPGRKLTIREHPPANTATAL